MKKETTKAKSTEIAISHSIDQMSFARMIAQKLNVKLTDVIAIVEEEQKLTMEYVKMGYKVIKKNYLTLEGRKFNGKKNWICPLNGKTYDLEANTRVLVRVGDGFKQFIAEKKMPEKLCRFVASSNTVKE